MSQGDAGDGTGRRAAGSAAANSRAILRTVPRAATDRLQAVIAADEAARRAAQPADPAPRGRRKFRDSRPTAGPNQRRKD